MRLSIRKHHDQFLKNLAEQMQTEPSVALDYLLWTVRRQGFSFGHPLAIAQKQIATPQQATVPAPIPGKLTPFMEIEPDPVIEKFAKLIEEF